MNTKPSSSFNQWIFSSFGVSSKGLGLLRIVISLFILFFLIPGQDLEYYRLLSELPSDFFSPPPGPMTLLDDFPGYIYFYVIHSIILISVILMLVGYRTFISSLVAGVSILLLQGMLFSVGKINHEIVVPLVPVLMAFTNWGACFSVDSVQGRTDGKVYSWPLTLLALFIAFMMFTAGFPKILGGWLDPSTQAVKGHVLNQLFVKGRDALLVPYVTQIHSVIIWELVDWLTILFEVGFIISVLKSRWFNVFLILAVIFHFSTQMMMNISFLPNFLAYVVFLNWERIYQQVKTFFQRLLGMNQKSDDFKVVAGFGCTLILFFSVLKYLSMKEIFFPETDLMFHEFIIVSCAFIVANSIIVNFLLNKWSGIQKREIA